MHTGILPRGDPSLMSLFDIGRLPGERRMYKTTRIQYYWWHMTDDVYGIFRDYKSCIRSLQTRKNEN